MLTLYNQQKTQKDSKTHPPHLEKENWSLARTQKFLKDADSTNETVAKQTKIKS
jgi:hypothetical protein